MNSCLQELRQPPQVRPYGSPQIAAHAAQVWIARVRESGCSPREIADLWHEAQDSTPRVDMVWKMAKAIDGRVTT